MPKYRDRSIAAPDREWLNVDKAADYLGLSAAEFLERVSLEVFPPGSPSSLRKSQWDWQTVQALSWLRPWLDTLYAERKRSRRKPGGPDEGSEE